jgi:hypothetical protein
MATSDGVNVVEIDDVIPRLYQDQIEAEATSDKMAWFFSRESARRVPVEKAGVPFKTLLRIRLGLFTQNPAGGPYHNPHVDFYLPHYNALYYVNDTDGDTYVFKETYDDVSLERSVEYAREGRFTTARRISPKKGRMVGFDGKHYHASMHPTQSSHRIAIAFSFV